MNDKTRKEFIRGETFQMQKSLRFVLKFFYEPYHPQCVLPTVIQ